MTEKTPSMEREHLLFFSSSSLLGRIGNIGLALVGPIGVPTFTLIVLWLMIKVPFSAGHVFPFFAAGMVFLYLSPGPMWAFQVTSAATVIGLLGFILTDRPACKLLFLANIGFLWALFYLMSRVNGRYQAVRHGLNEELDRLEITVGRFNNDVRQMKTQVTESRKRIHAYHRLESFIDDLVGAYSQQELINRAQSALEDMFPKAQVSLRIFPEKNQPNSTDIWGQRSLQSSQAVLFTTKVTPIPTLALGKFIFVPLVVGGGNIGWMGLDLQKDDAQFDIHDLRLAGIASNLVGLALHNADLYSQTQALATTDSLTGLHTRGYFDERFQEEFSKARRRGENLAFIIMDVDNFKKINDSYGHYMGDEILRWMSRMLSGEVRETDLLARYGGDEFVILMPYTRAKEALDFGNRLHKKIAAASFKWEKEKIKLTISGGVSGIKKDFETVADMVHEADQALYKAKQNGRNQVAAL